MSVSRQFQGFPQEGLEFLADLGENNAKPWFEAHKADFERHVVEPLRLLERDLSEAMLDVDPLIRVGPGAVSRIYRDTRFSRDKSPYKTKMWLVHKRPAKEWKDAPAFFFEVTATDYRYGMGFCEATPDTMANFRAALDERLDEFNDCVAFLSSQSRFEIAGELYKKSPAPGRPESLQRWYQRRNLYLVYNSEADATLRSPKVLDDMLRGAEALAPLYRFLLHLKPEAAGALPPL